MADGQGRKRYILVVIRIMLC